MAEGEKKKTGCLSVIGNIIWIIAGGIFTSIGWFLLGIILCVTIIGIPFGKQCFKFAYLTLVPFGKTVNIHFDKHPIANVLWLIFFGWEMFLSYAAAGIASCLTIIGIPFGIQAFKFSILGFFPFGATVE